MSLWMWLALAVASKRAPSSVWTWSKWTVSQTQAPILGVVERCLSLLCPPVPDKQAIGHLARAVRKKNLDMGLHPDEVAA